MRFGLAEVTLVGMAVAVLSIPPTLGWVPRNPVYGFRVPATLRSDRVWYAMNRRFGRELIVVGIALATIGTLLDAAGLDTPTGRAVAVVAMIASLVTTTVRGWRSANRMERSL
jgi:uncharacterized membrane protein